MRSVNVRTARGVKSRLTIARSALWGGGSMSSIDLRASSSSGPRSSSEVPPRSEEKVRQSLATAVMSACLVIAQKPRPSRSACQWTGSSRRSTANISCGTRSAKRV